MCLCVFIHRKLYIKMFKSVDSDTRAVSRFNQTRARLQVIRRSREFSVSPDLCVSEQKRTVLPVKGVAGR